MTKVWKVQGAGGTNPLKAKRKVKTNLKTCGVADAQIAKAEKKPEFVKNCMKKLNLAMALAKTNSKSMKTTPNKPEDNRYTLDRWELYLNCCATYHAFFAKEFLQNVKNGDTTLTYSCNTGITITNTRGWWGEFQAWLNEQGIANLLSISMVKATGYIVSSHTRKDWVVFTTKGKNIVFKRDTGVTKGMLYINLRTNKSGLAMIEMVRKNFGSYAKKKIGKAKLSCTVQSMI